MDESLFCRNEENHIVLTLVLISIALYLLLIVYFAKIERSLKTKNEIINLPDNHAADSFRYYATIETFFVCSSCDQ